MKYIFTKEGKEIEATLERWAWGIIYNDQTEIKQFGDDGVFHQVGEIDQDKIAMAVLYKPEDIDTKRIDIPWQPGMKLIHKYRNVVLRAGEEGEKRFRIYMFGYRIGSHEHFNYILPDDRIIQSPFDNIDLTLFGIDK